MRVMVGIPTHDRATILARTLPGHLAQVMPGDVHLTVLVVANACTDNTGQLLSNVKEKTPHLEWIEEAALGSSATRNRAIAYAAQHSVDLLLFSDDDTFVSSDWAASYVQAFRAWPQHVVFGGPIDPRFEPPPPDWITDGMDHYSSAYGVIDYGSQDRDMLASGQLPFGANMGYRFAAIANSRFEESLGITATERAGGEEIAFARSVLHGRHSWRYVARARCEHLVPAPCQSKRFLSQYFRSYGFASAKADASSGNSVTRLFGRPRWAVKQLLRMSIACARHRYVTRDNAGFARAFVAREIARGAWAARAGRRSLTIRGMIR